MLVNSILPEHGVKVEYGVELVSFEQFEDHVAVKLHHLSTGITEEANFKYVVGCDGARSGVRKQLGLGFVGESQTLRFFAADVKLPDFPDNVSCSSDSIEYTYKRSQVWHIWGTTSEFV